MARGPAINAAFLINAADTGVAAKPNVTDAVLFNSGYCRVTPRLRRRAGINANRSSGVFRNAIQTAFSSNPKRAVGALLHGTHSSGAIVFRWVEDFRFIASVYRDSYQPGVGAYPVVAHASFSEVRYIAPWEALRQTEVYEFASVKSGQTIAGAEPKKPATVADNLIDDIARQPLRNRYRLHRKSLSAYRTGREDHSNHRCCCP